MEKYAGVQLERPREFRSLNEMACAQAKVIFFPTSLARHHFQVFIILTMETILRVMASSNF